MELRGISVPIHGPRNRRGQKREPTFKKEKELSVVESSAETPWKPIYGQDDVVDLAQEIRDLRERFDGKTKLLAHSLA